MDRVRLRVTLDLTIIAKEGWKFEYTDDGAQVLRSSSGEHDASRETLIKTILDALEHATLVDDMIVWHTAGLDISE